MSEELNSRVERLKESEGRAWAAIERLAGGQERLDKALAVLAAAQLQNRQYRRETDQTGRELDQYRRETDDYRRETERRWRETDQRFRDSDDRIQKPGQRYRRVPAAKRADTVTAPHQNWK